MPNPKKIPISESFVPINYETGELFSFTEIDNQEINALALPSALTYLHDTDGKCLYLTAKIEWVRNRPVQWSRNNNFIQSYRIKTYSRGRSRAQFVLQSANGGFASMMLKDMLEMLSGDLTIIDGWIAGKWTVVKRGSNYGLRYVHGIKKEIADESYELKYDMIDDI